MKIGVPKEIKDNENRVAMTPTGVTALVGQGHQVFVQKDAGLGSSFTNEDYQAAGAHLLATADEVFGEADMILKVKDPMPEEFGRIREGQLVFTYLHLAASRELTEALLKSGCIGIAYETIQMPNRSLPLLTPMSEIAGRMSVQIGAQYLEKRNGGRGDCGRGCVWHPSCQSGAGYGRVCHDSR
jgi:alanine dehydrogenase